MTFNPKDHLMKIQGRDYLNVAWRLVWFRDQHPGGTVLTEIVSMDPLLVKATVTTPEGVLATGHGSANTDGRKVVWSGREIEKAETAAIGRALAHAGFGTQFTGEDEAENLADSPVANGKPAPKDYPKTFAADDKTEWPGAWIAALLKSGEFDHANHAVNRLKLSKVITPDAPLDVREVVAWSKKYAEAKENGDTGTAAAKFADTNLRNYLDAKEAA